jgi:hypothetical protein
VKTRSKEGQRQVGFVWDLVGMYVTRFALSVIECYLDLPLHDAAYRIDDGVSVNNLLYQVQARETVLN